MKNIILVGFMGTGKTAVARRLSKRLKMRYLSTDDMIEDRENKEIRKIFAEDGEPHFRKVEKEAVKEASSIDGVVIAAGGGAVLDDENIQNMKKKGVVICLNATPEAILKRTESYAHRPLLNVADPMGKIKELLDKRAPHYMKADHQVDTDGKDVKSVTEEIIRIVGGA